MIEWNGKSFLSKEIALTIDSDASLTGWGAVCQNQRRSMVPDRMQDAYKLSGAIGCNTSSPHILENQNIGYQPSWVHAMWDLFKSMCLVRGDNIHR